MNTVLSTTKIKKSAKVIKYQNELSEELIKIKDLIKEVDGKITEYLTELKKVRILIENSESPKELILNQQSIETELRNLRNKKDELIAKTNTIERELGDVLYLNEILYSDINPYEVVEMITPNKWVIRKLDTNLKPEARKKIQDSFCPGGFAGHVDNDCQEWDISVNENNPLITVFRGRKNYFFRKNKHFKIGSLPMSMSHSPIKIYDFNF